MFGWFHKKRELLPFDGGLSKAMRAKDPELYAVVGPLPMPEAWRVWKQKHPEDFPLDGQSPVSAASIVTVTHG